MKKFLFSVLACGMVATGMTSCQNEANEPVFNASGIESSFPKDSKVATIKLNMPDDARTRGEADPSQPLPLWASTGGQNIAIPKYTVRYGVYRSDGTLFYESDTNNAELLDNSPSNITLKLPLPLNDENAKVFVWADQLGADSKTLYNIDWTEKTVSYDPSTNSILSRDMAKMQDAFFYWGSPDGESKALRRPYVQINLVSDEFDLPSVMEEYKYGVECQIYLGEQDGNLNYPTKWNWDTDAISFEKNKMDKRRNPLGCTYWDQYKFDYLKTFPKANIGNGRKAEYLGVFYVFAPQTRGKWINSATGKTINKITFLINRLTSTSLVPDKKSIVLEAENLPEFKANERIVLYNANKPGEGDGILTSSSNFKGSIAGAYLNTDGETPDATNFTFTRK